MRSKRVQALRYYRGVLIPFIAERLFGDKDKHVLDGLHTAFKRRFSVETTSTLTHMEIVAYTANIRTAMSTEWGLLCPLPNDPEGIDEMDMKEFLKLYLTDKS